MIKELTVKNLNGRFDYEFEFYEDLNLFTGHIGTGKTTLLKLIWFLTSGNIHRVISEIPFNFVSIDTSEFSLSMEYINPNKVRLNLSFTEGGENSETQLSLKPGVSVGRVLEQQRKVYEPNKRIARVMKSSLFFPTFRRMERHFGLDIIGEPLSRFASELSVGDHKFIAAVSTHDVIDLLTEKHTEIAKGKQNPVDDNYETLTSRWNLLEELVHEMFDQYNGIRITTNIVLGADKDKTEDPIPSPNLSSGEKQLLGFLCYNAFSEAEYIFIDEPELSLHPDWQRVLITLLEYQGTQRRFFIASHSPYIGIKYEDKSFELRR